ncbi:MAG TPA: TadE/TadG family type IV pilus assembly protein [Microvirga sp.]|nr:TadE/TadG family type IV pilus assembly protein [Microvirga sp.]
MMPFGTDPLRMPGAGARTLAPRRGAAQGSAVATFLRAVAPLLCALWQDRRGNVAIATALALPVLVGGVGLGIEVGYWYYRQQAMQNAADSAAVAAATAAGTSYDEEARGVSARYGLTHGQSEVTVDTVNGVTCPEAPPDVVYSECYRVTVTSLVPLFLSPVVGYGGTATVTQGGKTEARTRLVATAVAARSNTARTYCIVALGQADVTVDLDFNGAPKADLKDCGLMSNEGMVCSGNAQKVADYADSPTGDSSPCGQQAHSMPSPKIVDPYAALAANIPDHTCPSPPYSVNTLTAVPSGDVVNYCGTLKIGADLDITTPKTIVIRNGNLDLNNHTLKGSALTIIFSGTDSSLWSHVIEGKGTLDIKAPTSGTWKGVALYQDPSLTQNVNFTAAGSNQTVSVQGLFYFPKAEVTLSGAVNKDVSPAPCFMMMVGSLRVNGGGFFADSNECRKSKLLDLPSRERGRLVM